MNLGDVEVRVKQEGESGSGKSRSSQWSLSHKNPRIVRVSRNFGGKDRHSKVCTVRGLRDRRIRLSVPTAVQLYDLQEKLGLSQPSKVVDWLLDATKADIDKLPPLPTIPGLFPNPNIPLDSPNPSKLKTVNEDFAPFVAQTFFPLGNNNPFFHWDTNPNPSHFGPAAYNPPLPGEDLNPPSHLYFCPNAPTIPPFPSYLPPSMDPNLGFSTALHLMTSPFAFKPHPHKED